MPYLTIWVDGVRQLRLYRDEADSEGTRYIFYRMRLRGEPPLQNDGEESIAIFDWRQSHRVDDHEERTQILDVHSSRVACVFRINLSRLSLIRNGLQVLDGMIQSELVEARELRYISPDEAESFWRVWNARATATVPTYCAVEEQEGHTWFEMVQLHGWE